MQWRDVATIFTDITGFTSLVESAPPETLGALLNEYVGGMTETIFAHEGRSQKSSAMRSRCSSMRRAISRIMRRVRSPAPMTFDAWAQDFCARQRAMGVNFGTTRIGIHAGPALVGNFGGNRFFDYTAYGDTINIAARLEAANKHLGTRICASASVAKAAEHFQGRPVGDLMLRGRSEPLRAFEPLPQENSKRRGRRNIPRLLPRWKPATSRPCRPSPRWSGCTPTIPWPAFT
ncbi:adenylate/guanylate cyclase domain-containing protein [Bradyrhizobium japonicum]